MVMLAVRRALRRAAVVTIACHLVLLAASVQAIFASTSIAEAEAACTCAHSDGVMCPMHHGHADPNECAFRSGADSAATVALMSLLGTPGMTPAATFAPAPAVIQPQSRFIDTPLATQPSSPPSPPPRS